MTPVEVIKGDSPIILGQPHSGTYVPASIWKNLNALGQQLIDTDWHIPTLYSDLLPNATIIRANFSRYVIDANRDPQGTSLYPGQNTTQLVPLQSFDGESLWKRPPSVDDIDARIVHFHTPYHAALKEEIQRVKSIHGFVILYDCHSIRSHISHLFEGRLPDLNIGNNDGATCAQDIVKAMEHVCRQQTAYRYVINGRFKGGWTTRHYGRPKDNIHSVQMEIAQRAYLISEAPPFIYDANKAKALREVLCAVFEELETTMKSIPIQTEA